MVKKALCCGLNYPKQKYQVYGCINDCLNWAHLLEHTFQFDECRVLIDQNPDGTLATAPTQIPTRANILAQLGWLCSGAEQGDCLAFVFAGLGCQVRGGGAYGEVDEALVPEDFTAVDERGNPSLVFEDDLHALFMRLPAGSFLTVILDCCHSSQMLDVPCSMDGSQRPPKVLQTCTRPREVHNRTDEGWQQALVKHALAFPRFAPTVTFNGGPRQRRTPPASGSHVGRMTLNPGVTAFCFAASRTHEIAYDASIKAHQQGVMSFCLLEALAALRNRCTYEQLLERASEKMDDIREKYMKTMDQYIQLSFCPNSAPSEVVVLDARYANAAQHSLHQRAKLAERGQSGDGYQCAGSDRPPVVARDVSSEFVPSPMYHQTPANDHRHGNGHQGPAYGPPQGPPQGPPHGVPPGAPSVPPGVFGVLYLRVLAAHNLTNTDTGILGDVSDPFVVAKLGNTEHKTPTLNNTLNPVWNDHNQFIFHSHEHDRSLHLEVMNSNVFKNDCLGKLLVDLYSCEPGQWHHRRERLHDGGKGEIEFDIRYDRGPVHPEGGPPQQPMHGGYGQGPSRPCAGEYQHHPEYGHNQRFEHDYDPMHHADHGRPPYPDQERMGMSCRSVNLDASVPCMGQPPGPTNLFGTPNLLGGMPNMLQGFGATGIPGMQPPGVQQPGMQPPGMPPALQTSTPQLPLPGMKQPGTYASVPPTGTYWQGAPNMPYPQSSAPYAQAGTTPQYPSTPMGSRSYLPTPKEVAPSPTVAPPIYVGNAPPQVVTNSRPMPSVGTSPYSPMRRY